MNVSDCPTPKKRAYDTRTAAEAKASVSSRKLYPYQCQCGQWHLTMRATTAPTAQSDVLEALASMPDETFSDHVTSELRGKATPEVAAALRTTDMAYRWKATLQRMLMEAQAELALKKGMEDPKTKQWRAAMVRNMGFIHARMIEIRTINATRKDRTSEEQLKTRAANAAKRALIGAHFEEYRQYLTEELAKRGLEFEENDDQQERSDG